MQNSNGNNVDVNGNNQLISLSKFEETKSLNFITSAENELLLTLKIHDLGEMVESFKMLHDFALYHTDLNIDQREKQALFELKMLWQHIEDINKSK